MIDRAITPADGFIVCPEVLGFQITVGAEGFKLELLAHHSGKAISADEVLTALAAQSGFGRRLSRVLPILLEQDIALFSRGSICVCSQYVYSLYDSQYGFADYLPPFAPLRLFIGSTGSLGFENFAYQPEFRVGIKRAYPIWSGPFAKLGSVVYLLSREVFEAMTELDAFDQVCKEYRRDLPWALRHLARVKSKGSDCVFFDKHLQSQNVLEVERVNIGREEVGPNLFTLFPYFDDVSVDVIKNAHFKIMARQPVYELPQADGSRLRVVPSEEVLRAIDVISKTHRYSASKVESFLEHALEEFSEVDALDAVNISTIRELEVDDSIEPTELADTTTTSLDGNDIAIELDGDKELLDSSCEVTLDSDSLDVDSLDINSPQPVSQTFEQLQPRGLASQSLVSEGVSANYQLSLASSNARLYDANAFVENEAASSAADEVQNFEIVERLAGEWRPSSEGLVFEMPASLLKEINGEPFALKSYQKQGIAWLQLCLKKSIEESQNRRQGALLADDMGLGKTLQVLVFLAWCIESALPDCLGKDVEVFEPILIVSPLILLPVWEKELKKFFNASGAIFQRYIPLHAESLNRLRLDDGTGRKSKALDVEELRRYRLVITNYDTVKNYFSSFSKIPWSVVIADEAQEIKEAQTTISECMRNLNRRFSIAVTGTPVENKLLDIWSILEFVQPKLLGDYKTFKKSIDSNNSRIIENTSALKKSLQYSSSSTYVLRRLKDTSLDGLPKKRVFARITPLTDEQRLVHSEVMQEFRAKTTERSHFACIQRLLKIYQHIALDSADYLDKDASEYLQRSYKLTDCINLLREIKRRREKVLLFTRTIDMQIILKQVIEQEFGPVEIINGAAATGNTSNTTRQRIISEFEATDGFKALILSPEVAGVGLTITAANNVIHYGRWWNPAKESQATDRVYRLGQTRDVNVYHLLSTAETYPTFDEKLHMMLASKMNLARDFLVPADNWTVKESDLLQDLAMESAADSCATRVARKIVFDSLSNSEFEAFIAYYWRKEGYSSYLLPSNSAEVARLLALGHGKALVVKFGFDENETAQEQTSELPAAVSDFKARFARGKLGGLQWQGVLCTKQRLSKAQRQKLSANFIVHDRNDFDQFVKANSCSMTDVLREDCNRIRSMGELDTLLQ